MVNNLYTCMSWILFFTFGCMYSSLLLIHIPQNGQHLVSKAHVFATSLMSTIVEIMSLVNGLSPPWSIIAMFGSSFSFHEEIMTCRSLSFISMRRRHFMHQGEAISIVVRSRDPVSGTRISALPLVVSGIDFGQGTKFFQASVCAIWE